MSIYKPKRSPFYHYDFEIDGYRFSGSTKCGDAGDAKKAEDQKRIEAQLFVDKIRAAGLAPMTLKAACDRWWDEHGQHLADHKIKSALDRLIEIIGAKTPLHAITDDKVSRMVAERRKDLRPDRTLREQRADGSVKVTVLRREIKAATVNRTIALLKRVMRRARDNWDAAIFKEPIWKKHWLKEAKRHVRELLPSEENILDEIEDADFADLRRFAIITGLRRGNVLVKKTQVDFELGVIRVITKGGTPRVIPLSAEAYQILWRRLNHHETHFFTFVAKRTRKCPKTGRAFVKDERYPITYYGMGSNKRKWLKAGVDARIHDLRHTTGMRTLRATGNLRVVQKLLGHTDIAITAKFYTDATLEDLRHAMDATAAAQRIKAPAPKQIKKKSENE